MKYAAMISVIWLFVASPSLAGSHNAEDPTAPPVETYLTQGRLGEGAKAMEAGLGDRPKDQQARFSLGIVQVLLAVEKLAQSLYNYGFGEPLRQMPGAGAIVPHNPAPKQINYDNMRGMFLEFAKQITQAQRTLSEMGPDEVHLPLHVGLIRLDLNASGVGEEDEALWRLQAAANPWQQPDPEAAAAFVIAFDRADAHWLEGYCHVLLAVTDFLMAYDEHDLFERTAHFFFPDVDSPYRYLAEGRKVYDLGGADISDLIAMIHLINFPLEHPQRMQTALEHLQAMLAKSRACWAAISAETDDDREWIPNANQSTVVPEIRINREMISAWEDFLNEADAILAGRKLIPFWRGTDEQGGVNLNRVFTQPQPFDLVLWIQGSAAKPYLEKGELSSGETWSRLQRLYNGNFIGYAFWFN